MTQIDMNNMDPYDEYREAPEGCGTAIAGLIAMIAIGVMLLFCSCKTCVPVVEVRDSIRTEYKLDSVYIYQHDSIFRDRWRSGDTVYVQVEKWQTRYKDKIVLQHDTIRTNEKIVQNVEVVPKFYKNCTIALWVLVVLGVLAIVARILIKIYLRR